jgi:hypothetical protein
MNIQQSGFGHLTKMYPRNQKPWLVRFGYGLLIDRHGSSVMFQKSIGTDRFSSARTVVDE